MSHNSLKDFFINKKHFVITIACFLILFFELADAQIQRISGGHLNGNNTWSGTIIVAGDIVIEENSRLMIEAGTQVIFEPNRDQQNSGKDKTRSEIIVKGLLLARGLPGKKISFTSKSPTPRMGDWAGIEFLHLKTGSLLEYCIVEYAYNGVTIKNSKIQINQCEIRYNYHAGIRTKVKATPVIKNSIISENGYAGIVCELGAKPILTDNLISLNRIGVVVFSLAQPNLGFLTEGDGYNPGRNRIYNNEEYNLYNHSNKLILAENNFWGEINLSAIAAKTYDNQDNSKYGTVDYDPVLSETGQQSLGNLLLLAQNNRQQEPASATAPDEDETNTNVANSPRDNQEEVQAPDTVVQASRDETLVSETIIPVDENLLEKLEETTPLIASTKTTQSELSGPSISNQAIDAQIDYDQIFLEFFLDAGNKVYRQKPKFKVTKILRNVLVPGEIRIKVVVGKKGEVEDASVLRGINEILDQAVLATVQKYKYQPGTVNGQTVKFTTSEVFRFE